jgi:hypothetical protein
MRWSMEVECQGRRPRWPSTHSPASPGRTGKCIKKRGDPRDHSLLGAVCRAQVLSSLFNYLGATAEYDDVVLHRAAAVRQAAEHVKPVTEEDQETLVGLIDSKEREVDPPGTERPVLGPRSPQLGDDAAFKILYDEVPFEVKGDPDELFGFEKERLVRPLSVYARARDQGESG